MHTPYLPQLIPFRATVENTPPNRVFPEVRSNYSLTNIPRPAGATPPVLPQTRTCLKCRRLIDAAFAYCPHCGTRQRAGDAWYYHPVWILLMALFVLGPFALGLVWRSGKMNTTMKWVFTAGIGIYTLLTVYYTYQIFTYEWSALHLDELDAILK